MTTTELFKINKIGIDTSSITLDPSGSDSRLYDFVYTKISANNDYLLKNYIISEDDDLIVGIDSLYEELDVMLTHHLECLGCDQARLLLLDSSLIDEDTDLSVILHMASINLFDEIGIMNPTKPEQIELLSAKLGGVRVEWVGMDICPINFNAEIIKYCNDNNIELIGFNPFGGHVSAPAVIDSFSCPYLLGFAAYYCQTVILSGRDLAISDYQRNYLISLEGQQGDSKFILRKSVSRLIKPLKPLIRTSFIVDNYNLPYDSPESIYRYPAEIAYNFIDTKNSTALVIPPATEIEYNEEEVEVIEYINSLNFPKDADLKTSFAFLRYKILSYLDIIFSTEWGWEDPKIVRVNDRTVGITVMKNKTNEISTGWALWKKTKTETYPVEKRTIVLSLPEVGAAPIYFEARYATGEA